MKVFIVGSLALLVVVLLTELTLRLILGLGNPPLYIPDEHIGYLLAPNQRIRRLGNLIIINQYSMRTEAIEKSPAANTLRVFLMGDSIVNGNWWTDQSDTLSARIENALSPHQLVEVLNASANSWGPRNELAYLQRFGIFESQIVMLVINTDDLFGTQPSPLQVGKDRSYPDKKPLLALLELTNRFKKQPPIPGLKEIQNEPGDRIGKNLLAIADIQKYVAAHDGQLLLAMTPLKREVLDGPRDYEIIARQRVDDLVEQQQIPYIDFLAVFQSAPDAAGLYRDHIHLSPIGNNLVTQSITDLIRQSLPAQP
ncbi:SGNH/GDSL hydrolase family protein [Leptothoe sp. PORK10 BA2]|uniref:SGNH/GDSL hydrolase family protein n=1 Tax=Leptothoe sp. PORK10 BA2 TaxID=3110254 RepID=UPI002B2175AF|nr:SGNH/GDSL hydrolase family protein [Leptothoe sp. PORK10 BA2]MEA5465944.1 SGNH/GDSL hydrolase family protein [Leptothoe sp. PORK10 BA2]